jgi:ketohexokinase
MTEGFGRILGVGVAALDIIHEVSAYPLEDTELRALERRTVRGGNTANTLAVLQQLGYACAWSGTLGGDAHGAQVREDLEARGIDTAASVLYRQRSTPTSYIVLSRANGSRTIVHYRDLPELTAAEFLRVRLDGYDWVHFEGRDPNEIIGMMRDCAQRRPGIGISLEVEKPRPNIESLFSGPDVLIFSRHYAHSQGYADPQVFLADQRAKSDAGLLVLPWGEEGAYAQPRGEPICFASAYRPYAVRDTLGAGDVFNAALIHGLLAKLDTPSLLAGCNALAGYKCGMLGLDGLVASARRAGIV